MYKATIVYVDSGKIIERLFDTEEQCRIYCENSYYLTTLEVNIGIEWPNGYCEMFLDGEWTAI